MLSATVLIGTLRINTYAKFENDVTDFRGSWLCKLLNTVFLGYKMGLFSFQNNSKNLDLFYKTDLDIWDCLGRVNSYYSKIAKD